MDSTVIIYNATKSRTKTQPFARADQLSLIHDPHFAPRVFSLPLKVPRAIK